MKQIPCSTLTESGRFRDNRRGTIGVEVTARDMAELVITLPPGYDGRAGERTRVVLAGNGLRQLVDALQAADTYGEQLQATA